MNPYLNHYGSYLDVPSKNVVYKQRDNNKIIEIKNHDIFFKLVLVQKLEKSFVIDYL